MLDYLVNLDTQLFLALNGLHSPFWDTVMWIISDKFIWIPLYVVIIYFLIRRYKRESVWWILAVALVVLLSDQISSGLIKPMVERWRPSRDPALDGLVHIVNNYRGGRYGFVSSHAANTFGVAVLLSCVFQKKWITISFVFWAVLVSYSRIYLGVHFPGDVICGAAIGIGSGIGVWFFTQWANRKIKEKR